MENAHPIKQKSKSVDLEAEEIEKPHFNSLEQIEEEPNYRKTLKGNQGKNVYDSGNGPRQETNSKLQDRRQSIAKGKFLINNTKQISGNNSISHQALLDRKTTHKNFKNTSTGVNTSITQKLPQMSSSYLKKSKQPVEGKKTQPLTDVTNPSTNVQWKKLQQVKKTIEEKKALINQFESVNR